jgi:hypothetical protein
MVGLTGLEPVTLRLSSACSNQLSYRPGIRSVVPLPFSARSIPLRSPNRRKNWWRHGDSNPRPIACKATALPTELYPHLAAIRRIALRSVRCFFPVASDFVFFVCFSFVLSCHKQKLNCALPFQSIRGIRPLDRTQIALCLNKSKPIERSTYVHQLGLEADKLLRLSEVLNIDSLERR